VRVLLVAARLAQDVVAAARAMAERRTGRRPGDASISRAAKWSSAAPAGGSETPIMVSRRLSSSGSTMAGTGCGWGRMDGHGETRNPILYGGGPASPCPSTRLGGRRGREYRGRGCKPVCMPDFFSRMMSHPPPSHGFRFQTNGVVSSDSRLSSSKRHRAGQEARREGRGKGVKKSRTSELPIVDVGSNEKETAVIPGDEGAGEKRFVFFTLTSPEF